MALIVKTNKEELDAKIATLQAALAAVNSFQITASIESAPEPVVEPIAEVAPEVAETPVEIDGTPV